jgi:eukaryotic-like serine/threonine-protein kinase
VVAVLAIAAPITPDLERKVALSRLKQRLFAREAAVTLGRYHLLERVGKGGMGVVWGAWDPKLERRVAIKVLVPTISEARERMLLEGQALAKLSHPNVVPIYDVGVIDEQVYLVMEWVRGQSLREYAAEPRSVRELIAVYRQAGEGLAAAHRAGLIHRDFKPDNAIRGEDGRVRVLDFGLARGETDAAPPVVDGDLGQASPVATRGAGTPRYMAPEQASGAALTAAADQFAFCTALREALWARRGRSRSPRAAAAAAAAPASRAPIARWLAALLDRGTSEAPARRFPDMAALLAALDRETMRRWRRRGLALATAGLALAAFAFGRTHAVDDVDPCSGGAAEIAAAWSPASRAQLAAHLDALGAYGHEQIARVTGAFDAVAATWVLAHRQGCTAHRRAELPAELYQRRLGCLARSKVALGTAAELLVTVARDGLDNALVAARSLPDAGLCAEQDAAQVTPPPAEVAPRLPAIAAEIEKARILAVALRPEAGRVAGEAVAAAEGTSYAPVIARALLAQGRAAAALARWDEAAGALRRAVDLAVAGGDDVVAVEAFARLVFVASRRGQSVDGASIVERLAQRAGASGSFSRALLYNNLATAELARADRAAARRWLLAAQREIELQSEAKREPKPEVDIELVSVAQNLALVADDPVERLARASAVVALLARALGDHHGKTLAARGVEANETADRALASQRFAELCERYRLYQPHLAAAMALCNYRLGWLADERGDLPAARQAMSAAVADPSKERLQAEVAALYLRANPLAAEIGDVADIRDAREAVDALLALAERFAADAQFWKRVVAVEAVIAAATALDRLDARSPTPRSPLAFAALRAWRRALALGESLDPPQMQRRLARIRAALARHLLLREPAVARTLAERSLVWMRAAGGYEAQLRALEALLAALAPAVER